MQVSTASRPSLSTALLFLFVATIGLRLLTMSTPALVDTTEGRYGAIAQEMALSGDWITPRVQLQDQLVPYTGKPPLYFWLAGISIKVLGNNEFAVRFPSMIAALIIAACVFSFSKHFWGDTSARLALVVLLSSLFFFFISGSAVIDLVLSATVGLASVTLARSFAAPDNDRTRRLWGLVFFTALGLGMLTKGPIALALVLLPAGIWTLLDRRRFLLWLRLPLVLGPLIFVLLVLPWFILAERESPGFIRYFFVNENFLRFVTKNYEDKFGFGHVQPRGMSWLFTAAALFPWSILIPIAAWRGRKALRAVELQPNMWFSYSLLMGIGPAIFFTPARQMTALYLAPSLTGLAISAGYLLATPSVQTILKQILSPLNYVLLAISVGVAIASHALGFGSISHDLFSAAILAGAVYVLKIGLSQSKNDTQQIAQSSMIKFAILLVAVYSTVLIELGPYISATRSTAPILAVIKEGYPNSTPAVGVPFGEFGNPFSPWFYDDTAGSRLLNIVKVNLDDTLNSPENIIAQRKQVTAALQANYVQVTEVGKWIWFKNRAVLASKTESSRSEQRPNNSEAK